MQSVKNTSVGILLLFLSYGVYQVMMKQVPSSPAENIEGLEITDAIDSFPAGSTAEFGVLIAANDPELPAHSIPPGLLQSPQAEAAVIQDDRLDMGEFDPPKSEFSGMEIRPDATAINSSEDFEPGNSNQFATKLDRTGDFDPDSRIITKPEMADVTPRPDPDRLVAAHQPEAIMTTDSAPASPPPASPPPTQLNLADAWQKINTLVEQGQYQQALSELSPFYHAADLNAADRQQLLDWLDALAAKVIYSSEHHLQSVPYIIQPGDTIASLARQWQVPAQLIYNINSNKITDPNELVPGVEIKMIQGPFDAEVEPDSQTLTLFLDGMYAGRFKINANSMLASGEFGIVNKSAEGQADRPYWISLSNGAAIYESDVAPTGESEIGLAPGEAEEVFSILSASSKIRILR